MALKLVANNPTSRDDRPAYAALIAHRKEIAGVQAEDLSWAAKESVELEVVRAAAADQEALAALEQQRVNALADEEILGSTAEDIDGLTRQIRGLKTKANAALERAQLATAKIERIRNQRTQLREKLMALNGRTRELQHAARNEHLASAMEDLLSAEATYVAALESAFGISTAIDDLARQPGIQLAFSGELNVSEVFLPRPFHAAFSDRQSAQRGDIAAAIAAVAERVAKEL
jgi:chromosome segregation ATPase